MSLKIKPKFKIGDKVRCINDIGHAIVFGKEYVIKDVQITCCNSIVYDVGLVTTKSEYTQCLFCREWIPGRNIHWACESRFAKKQYSREEIESEIEEAVEKEEFDRASELKKELEKVLY